MTSQIRPTHSAASDLNQKIARSGTLPGEYPIATPRIRTQNTRVSRPGPVPFAAEHFGGRTGHVDAAVFFAPLEFQVAAGEVRE